LPSRAALGAAGEQIVFGRYTLIKILGRVEWELSGFARDEELERECRAKISPDLMIQIMRYLITQARDKRCSN